MRDFNVLELIPLLTIILFNRFNFSFSLDYPQILEDKLIRRFRVNTMKVQDLYTIFSTISVIFAPFNAIIMNRLGFAKSGIIFSVLCFLGMSITYLGVSNSSWALIMLGRGVYSISAESGCILCVAMISERFKGKIATIFLTSMFTYSRIISMIANWGVPELMIRKRSLNLPMFYLALGSAIPIFTSLAYWLLYEKDTEEDLEKFNLSTLSVEFKQSFTLKHLKTLNPLFWSCLMCYALFPTTMYTLINTLTDLCMIRFGFAYSTAKDFIQIIQFSQMIMMPFGSIYMQNFGKKANFLLVGSILSIFSLSLMIMLGTNPPFWFTVLPFIIFSAFFSCYTPAIYPCLTIALPKDSMSIGLSLGTILQHGMLSLTPSIIGRLSAERTPQTYQNCLYFTLALATVGFFFAILVVVLQQKEGSILNLRENLERVKELRQRKEAEFREITKSNEKTNNTKKPNQMEAITSYDHKDYTSL